MNYISQHILKVTDFTEPTTIDLPKFSKILSVEEICSLKEGVKYPDYSFFLTILTKTKETSFFTPVKILVLPITFSDAQKKNCIKISEDYKFIGTVHAHGSIYVGYNFFIEHNMFLET